MRPLLAVLALPLLLAPSLAEADPGATGELGDVVHRDVGSLCRAWVAHTRAEDRSQTYMIENLVLRPPRCVAEPSPIPFRAAGTWRGLRVIHVDDGIATATRLVVETSRGLSLAPIGWNVDDPRDPGCPSIIRDVGIESVSVQRGALVVVMAGERTTYLENPAPPDPVYRAELVRVAHWGFDDGGAVKLSYPEPHERWAGGSKVQPHWEAKRWVAWERIPWQGYEPFTLGPDGRPPPRDDGG